MKKGPEREQAAPPDRFLVTTATGQRHTGAAAKVEIKYLDATKAPQVEVTFSASSSSGDTWGAYSTVPPDFLETLTLSARVMDRPLEPGDASIQVSPQGGETSFAPSGRLNLHLLSGWLVGDASGMSDKFAAKFEGPVVVTCAVPSSLMGVEAPTAAEDGELPTLVVDEKLESELCKRYATLGR